MARVKIGDLVEIKTKLGFSYAQYTHKNPSHGELLRVFERSYAAQPNEPGEVANDKVKFSTFFPLNTAISRRIFSIVGNYPVREGLKAFPIFRAGVVDPSTGKVAVWWLWDGETERKVGNLTEEQKKLSIRRVWNDTLLIESIESGWSPETDSTT